MFNPGGKVKHTRILDVSFVFGILVVAVSGTMLQFSISGDAWAAVALMGIVVTLGAFGLEKRIVSGAVFEPAHLIIVATLFLSAFAVGRCGLQLAFSLGRVISDYAHEVPILVQGLFDWLHGFSI